MMNISLSCKILGAGLVFALLVTALTPMAVVWARESALDGLRLVPEEVGAPGLLSPARKGMARFLVTDINATSDEALKQSALPVLEDAWVAQQEAAKQSAPEAMNALYAEEQIQK